MVGLCLCIIYVVLTCIFKYLIYSDNSRFLTAVRIYGPTGLVIFNGRQNIALLTAIRLCGLRDKEEYVF